LPTIPGSNFKLSTVDGQQATAVAAATKEKDDAAAVA
jgi:hypothetical protein